MVRTSAELVLKRGLASRILDNGKVVELCRAELNLAIEVPAEKDH